MNAEGPGRVLASYLLICAWERYPLAYHTIY